MTVWRVVLELPVANAADLLCHHVPAVAVDAAEAVGKEGLDAGAVDALDEKQVAADNDAITCEEDVQRRGRGDRHVGCLVARTSDGSSVQDQANRLIIALVLPLERSDLGSQIPIPAGVDDGAARFDIMAWPQGD